ncbi:helix-turn-helix domain-containing protein [Rufibacter sediminis]|uniref:Helix-turn-helix transcriptional regulator n=1 Tax=Rufibacter sediminis TaxID=2762756 RepID=A0ABR6VVI8_9BACT|nr:helix-turn-helix transcriptional regulator [Rufibacter sediminis]MBC3540909.1 helix-turn-helix transcriptional regulator [Rufibacter sediminis]
MKKQTNPPYIIQSVSELHRLLGIPQPEHPLVSMIQLSDLHDTCRIMEGSFMYSFYSVSIKKGFHGKLKYGQHYYDFDDGVMTFFSPGQVISTDASDEMPPSGWWLVFHPDFIRNYPLGKKIKEYGFFSYAVNEALHLSEKEEAVLDNIQQNIAAEYTSVIDAFSQDVMVSHIEVLLNYGNRFYNRQFLTRKSTHHDLLVKLETVLDEYFRQGQAEVTGLPTVQYVSDKLNLSPNYLSDMLRSLTGQSTQQHIQHKLIEKAKESLSTTSLTVSEIAYQLGFEYPQSFSKLFKSKTKVSPLAFRHSFN